LRGFLFYTKTSTKKIDILFNSLLSLFFLSLFGILRTEMRKEVNIDENQIKMARYAKALGHPTRVFILDLLSKQSCCYSGDLSEELSIAKSTLSQHLSELKDAGLIQGEIEAPRIKYCVNKENWAEAKLLLKDFFRI